MDISNRLREHGDDICLEAADFIDDLAELLRRYRQETPLGHQPHMIAHKVDRLLRLVDGVQNEPETGKPASEK